jgi:hypothetical protein
MRPRQPRFAGRVVGRGEASPREAASRHRPARVRSPAARTGLTSTSAWGTPPPRQVTAAKLRVSVSGLARAGITTPTTAEIENLKAENPQWLEREQAIQAEVRKEEFP